MADIRINSLPTTATSSASDDFIAIDGAANGTRKILASNIAKNVSDVVLGVNGPSVKSSLGARAARQGLVQDGTDSSSVSIPAFGNKPWTQALWINQTQIRGSSQNSYLTVDSVAYNAPNVYLQSDSNIFRVYNNSTILDSGYVVPLNKWKFLVVTSDTTNVKFYVDGVLVATVAETVSNYAGSITKIGGGAGSQFYGTIIPLIYNRALSASEVVSLFEAGVPAGADYNSATNTALTAPTAFVNYQYDTFTGATASGFTAAETGGQACQANTANGFGITAVAGSKFRITFDATLTSGSAPLIRIATISVGVASPQYSVVNGANDITVTLTSPLTASTGTGAGQVRFDTSGNTSYAIANLKVYPLGLLLAPDASQAGGGTTWYDTSGNAANITLPASGVSWNVPSSQKTASGWTYSGNLNVRSALGYATGIQSGTTSDSTQQVILSSSGGYNHAYIGKNGTNLGIGFSSTNNSFTEDNAITIAAATKAVTLAGNLTVSGAGTSSFAGNVGIATTSINTSVWGANYPKLAIGNGTANGVLTFQSTLAAANNTYLGGISTLNLGSGVTANEAADILFYQDGTSATNPGARISFFVRADGGGLPEAMRLNNAGNLLLGTTTDNTAKFQVYATPATAGYQYGIRLSDNATTTLALGLQNVAGSSLPFVYGNSGLGFGTNGATAVSIDGSQNSTFFGKIITSYAIGASASDSSTTTIQSGSSSGVKSNILLRDSWNGSNNNNAYFAVQLGDGSTTSDALRIDYQKNATFAGTITPKASTGSAVFALDTAGQTFTINNNATATPFGNANNFSGLFVVNDTNNTGLCAVFLTGGAGMILVSQTGTNFTNAVGTAGKTNVYLNGNVVTIENKSGVNTNYNVMAFRTRQSQ